VLGVAAALIALAGCSADRTDLQVGDCLKVAGTVDVPETVEVVCGSPESNFKVVATIDGTADRNQCPSDVDSSYSQRGGFPDSVRTVCMDIDWVVGGCMSVDPDHEIDPVRVRCADTSAPNRQRAAQILTGVASVDQCTSGQGYAYEERLFTVCVENLA
jgi:hypothetical protein